MGFRWWCRGLCPRRNQLAFPRLLHLLQPSPERWNPGISWSSPLKGIQHEQSLCGYLWKQPSLQPNKSQLNPISDGYKLIGHYTSWFLYQRRDNCRIQGAWNDIDAGGVKLSQMRRPMNTFTVCSEKLPLNWNDSCPTLHTVTRSAQTKMHWFSSAKINGYKDPGRINVAYIIHTCLV